MYKKKIKCVNDFINVHIFLTPFLKILPESNNDIISPEHANSGFTTSCEVSTSIVIYRQEEWFKVLCHETFHFFNLDFHNTNMLQVQDFLSNKFKIRSNFLIYESYCEFWATIWNTIFITFSKTLRDFDDFSKSYFELIEVEKLFSCFQVAKILYHNSMTYDNLLSQTNTRL